MFKLLPLRRTLPAALRDLESPKPRVRISAVRDLAQLALGQARRPALDALVGALRQDADARVRSEAAVALADAKAEEHAADLVQSASDAEPRVRQMAILALGEVGHFSNEEARTIVARGLRDDLPAIRFQALVAFHHLAGEQAMPQVLEQMDDEDAQVRYIALRIAEEHALEGGARAPPSGPVMARARAALADASDKVRLAAAILLARAGDESGTPQIVAAVDSGTGAEEPEDEQTAVELAGSLRLEPARAGLARRAWGIWGLPRSPFSFQACVALAQMGDQRAKAAIVRGLGAWTRDARTLSVVAAGRAGLVEASAQILAMRGDQRRADQDAVEEALSKLLRPGQQSSRARGIHQTGR